MAKTSKTASKTASKTVCRVCGAPATAMIAEISAPVCARCNCEYRFRLATMIARHKEGL